MKLWGDERLAHPDSFTKPSFPPKDEAHTKKGNGKAEYDHVGANDDALAISGERVSE